MSMINSVSPIQINIRLSMVLGAVTGALIWAMAFFLPPAIDWHLSFRPAVLLLLQGKSPYLTEGFLHAPWVLFPMIPLALLPEAYGQALLNFLNLGAITYTAYKLKARPLVIGAILISPPVFHMVLNGTIDGMLVLGFVLPPQIGLFFLMVKPQMGIAVMIFWLVDAWRKGGIIKIFTTFIPVSVALLLSFAIFGFWPIKFQHNPDFWWNASLWPMSIPVGLVLLVTGIRKRDIRYSMGASPCLSPYLLLHSWVVALLALVPSVPEVIAAVVGLWILLAIRAFGGG